MRSCAARDELRGFGERVPHVVWALAVLAVALGIRLWRARPDPGECRAVGEIVREASAARAALGANGADAEGWSRAAATWQSGAARLEALPIESPRLLRPRFEYGRALRGAARQGAPLPAGAPCDATARLRSVEEELGRSRTCRTRSFCWSSRGPRRWPRHRWRIAIA